MTTWNPNIPNPADVPASDATAMQQNFSVLDTAFAVDHVNLSLLTAQGFHKQVSLSNVGSPPYTVSGLQSYDYAKSLATNTRTYLEYQPAGGEVFAANPAVVPLSLKAYAVFDSTGIVSPNPIPNGNFKRRFNIASITATAGTTWAVVFNENMPDAFYSVQLYGSINTTSNGSIGVISQTASGFVIKAENSSTSFYSLVGIGAF